MKRRLFIGFVALALGTSSVTARAGGWHGGGGCWGGGWHGGGCYYGGHGWCGGPWWPLWGLGLGIGIGAAISSPSYSVSYGYPYYGSYPYYGYTYARPAYVYRPAQPYVAPVTTVAYAPTIRPAATAPAQVYWQPTQVASQPRHSQAATPAVVTPAVYQTAAPSVSSASKGTWVPDPNPYSYTPASTAARPNNTGAADSSIMVNRTGGSVPVYAVTR